MAPRQMPFARTSLSRRSALLGGVGLAGLGLAACSSEVTGKEAGGSDGGDGGGDAITIGYLPAWSDTLVMAFLTKNRLEALGQTVKFETFNDAAIIFAALGGGDIDIHPSAWPDRTHAQYVKKFKDDIEDLDTYNKGGLNFLAVPQYTDIDSMEDLAEDPDRFDGKIIGIEKGAGLTAMTQDEAMPAYGLDKDFELVASSTPAMLSELDKAATSEEDIVVTMWKPYWANEKYDVKPLKDPKKGFGDPETMHLMGRKGFTEDFADAADYIGRMTLTDEQFASAEDYMLNKFGEGKEEEAAEAWVKDNPDVLPKVD
jgi:glycine betaine/proline transport system substrate-binding protein